VTAASSSVPLLGARRSEAAPPGLSNADLDAIVAAAVTSANATGSGFRTSPTVQPNHQDQ